MENSNGRPKRQPNGDLWRPEDENYYNPDKASASSSSGGRWHYPANFDDVEPVNTGKKSKSKKGKKDRWERTQDAYSMSAEGDNQKKRKKKKRKSTDGDNSVTTRDSADFPEDPEGGLYGNRVSGPESGPKSGLTKSTDEEVFNHEF